MPTSEKSVQCGKVQYAPTSLDNDSGPEDRRITRKVDLRLLPILTLLYLLSFLDRSNIGNAKYIDFAYGNHSIFSTETVLSPAWIILYLPRAGQESSRTVWHKVPLLSKVRRQRSWRVAIFFGGAALAGGFGGIFAYAIGLMNGVGGRKGWQW
ncbi:hypothetical protein EDD17DRAFT_1513506 [Pisolithus thermaeus]|nr:hypothetical protein EDD17DRAFT_1513506 [Pisolithus thermaeus]